MHDPRVGRFFATDPLTSKYPWYSPYQFAGNKPIQFGELEGLEETGFTMSLDRKFGSKAYLNMSTAQRNEERKVQAVAGVLMITTLIDIYVTKGWLSRTATAYMMGDFVHSAQMQTYYRDQGNEAKAKTYEPEGAEASKGLAVVLTFEGVAYGVGKLLSAGSKLNLRVYRYEKPERVSGTWAINEYNIAANHRYTGSGQGGVYSSLESETALAEISHYGAQEGRVLVYKDFGFNKVLDLTKASVRKDMGVTLKQITSESYDVTNQLGTYAKENGYEAILAPSARSKGGTNVVILKQ
jgi:RES domain-containing protein